MKKILILFLMCFMLLPSFASASLNSSVDQEKGYPTAEGIVLMNEALDKMIVEANKKLEAGETEIFLEEKIGETNETVSLVFKSIDVSSNKETTGIKLLAALPSGKKIYYASVSNTEGFNFQHQLAGEFTYSGGKVNGATKDANLTGYMYSESHVTWIDVLDPSIWVVQSHGKFKALKYFAEYNTYITVRLQGSGDYRVERAEFGI